MKLAFRLLLILILPFLIKEAIAKTEWQKTTINRTNLPAELSTKISTKIGGYLFDIEGLTSPWAQVEFYSTENNIAVTTIANEQGKFFFNSVVLPLQTGDFCFLSYDIDGIANNPLCFSPPPPQTKTIIKGIILSPSFSFEKGTMRQGESTAAQGRSFPKAEIKVFLFEENRPLWRELLDLVRYAFAREGPKLTVIANQQGLFSFNLPTQKSGRWRLFVAPQFNEETPVAKSNTLEFSILAWWQWWLIKLLSWLHRAMQLFFQLLFHWKTIIALLLIAIGIAAKKIIVDI